MIINPRQLLSYLMVGLFAVFVDFMVYIFLKDFINIDPFTSKRVSYISGAIISFFFNKKLTFKSESNYFVEVILFIIIYAMSFFLNSLIHDFAYQNLDGYYPFIIALITSIVFNYLGQKYIVFRK